MSDSSWGDQFLVRAMDRLGYRLVLYAAIVLIVGIVAFVFDLALEHDFVITNGSKIDGLITSLAVMVGLCLFEFVMYGTAGRLRQCKAQALKADSILMTVVDAIPDLVYVKDVEGRHVLVNKAVQEFTGQTNDQLRGKTMADLLPPALAEACMESDNAPISSGRARRAEERFETASGPQVLDTIKAPVRDNQGKIIGIVGISRNITEKIKAEDERRELQAQLMHAQKMEALGHLAGGIAHDFNNILTVVVGYASLLKTKRPDDEVVSKQADQILAASLRGRAVIKGLFAFSSKQKIDKQALNLNDILSENRKLLLEMINDRIAMTLSCCDGPLTVMADQVQLERVLMNLASNARDAMPEGGELVFSTEHFEMGNDFIGKYGYGTPGAYAHPTVSDTGTGISEENQK
ncbi:MAG TPA: PAS domain-containing protein, partial [Nitrospirota bacterium]